MKSKDIKNDKNICFERSYRLKNYLINNPIQNLDSLKSKFP